MKDHPHFRFYFILSLSCTLGAILRLYDLPNQILIDDEWHSLTFVIGKTFSYVLTHFNPVDNSSPLFNIYDFLIYKFFWWSEILIRLPVILAGIGSLLFLPVLIRRILGDRVALIFSALLALSPFLIFFSRYVRTYGLMMLFCYSALIFFYRWVITSERKFAFAYVLTGSLAFYSHLFSLIAVFTPLATVLLFLSFEKTNQFLRKAKKKTFVIKPPLKPAGEKSPPIVIGFKNLFALTGIVSACISPLLLIVLTQSTKLPWQRSHCTLEGIGTALGLAFGSSYFLVTAFFFLLCSLGFFLLVKRNPLLGLIFLMILPAYFLAFLISSPMGIDKGVVLMRYMIVFVPIALTVMAYATDWMSSSLSEKYPELKRLPLLPPFLLIGAAALASPLPSIYSGVNNFTNHSTFQDSYSPHLWNRSDSRSIYPSWALSEKEVPSFYKSLRERTDIHTLIEYPLDLCDYNNLLYYFQHFHQKKIIAGYLCAPTAGYTYQSESDERIREQIRIGVFMPERIIASIDPPEKFRFTNMTDIGNLEKIKETHADMIILHKYFMALRIMPSMMDSIPVYPRLIPSLVELYKKGFGEPVFEDNQIICFRIK